MALSMPVAEIVEKSTNPLLNKHHTWERVLLGDVANILNGYAFKSSRFNNNSGFPLIRIRDVKNGTTETFYEGPYESKYIIQPGDLIIGMDGDFICARWIGRPGLLNQRVCKVTVRSPYYLPEFLDIVLPGYLTAINEKTSSVTVKHLSSKTISEIPLPFPPLSEQQQIVEKIEELFTQLDEGAAELQKAKAQLKRYRQAVLNAAVVGELTREWREAHRDELEPASELLERILAERRTRWEEEEFAKIRAKGKEPKNLKWKRNYKEPAHPDFEGLMELPEGWIWVCMEQLSSVQTGATPLRSNLKYWKDGTIPWVTSGALNELFISEPSELITELALRETNTKLFPKHTLLVAMYGEGKTRGKVSELLIEASTNQAIAALPFENSSKVIRQYIKLFLQDYYNVIRRKASGGVQPNLNLGIIKATTVPLPSFKEQKRIIERVERRLSVVEKVERQLYLAFVHSERLRQSIYKRAFEGKLVPQDPNDEPASELLGRIEKERQFREKEEKQKLRINRQRKITTGTKEINIETAKDIHKLLLTMPHKRAETERLWKESKLSIDRFYNLLNEAINEGYIVEHREEYTVYLEAIDEN